MHDVIIIIGTVFELGSHYRRRLKHIPFVVFVRSSDLAQHSQWNRIGTTKFPYNFRIIFSLSEINPALDFVLFFISLSVARCVVLTSNLSPLWFQGITRNEQLITLCAKHLSLAMNLWSNREQTQRNITVSDIGHYYYQRREVVNSLASNTWYSKSGSSGSFCRLFVPLGKWVDHNFWFSSTSYICCRFMKLKLLAGSWLCLSFSALSLVRCGECNCNVPVYFSTKNLLKLIPHRRATHPSRSTVFF